MQQVGGDALRLPAGPLLFWWACWLMVSMRNQDATPAALLLGCVFPSPGRRDSMPTMHWFWRAIVAIAAGAVLGQQIFRFIVDPMSAGGEVFGSSWSWWGDQIFALIPVVALPVIVYALLSHMYGPKVIDPETRCRKCGYILRGISEPRCPECGERI